jgi:curved DNA-binding protein CbpA
MIDLSSAKTGQLGKDVFFSDLYASASLVRFTGAILVRAPKEQAIFFRAGAPVHTGGPGFSGNYLGEILLANGDCSPESLSAALEQQTQAGAARPLLGTLLIREGATTADAVKRAIITQTEARALSMFTLVEGSWQSAPGENARIKEIGVPIAAVDLFIRGLKTATSDEELRATSDSLLGKAVQLYGVMPELGFDEQDRLILKYLEKPRKPDALERAGNRRQVRALLRMLLIFDKAKLVPAAQGIPLPKAAKPAGAATTPVPTQDLNEQDRYQTPVRVKSPEPRVDPSLVREMHELHASMEHKSHFEMLGVLETTQVAEIRKAFTLLQKRFHPDTFQGADDELLETAREISARMNEAYQTLTNDKTRAEYLEMWHDSRIKGDSRKAATVRDAEMKHQMGLVMLKKRDYLKAREYFNFAMTGDPSAGEYKASMAWAIFADPKVERSEASTKAYALILEALKDKPTATTHYYAGQILKSRDQVDEALYHFSRAQKLDPKNADAVREVRLLSGRKNKGRGESASLLDKLFKR